MQRHGEEYVGVTTNLEETCVAKIKEEAMRRCYQLGRGLRRRYYQLEGEGYVATMKEDATLSLLNT